MQLDKSLKIEGIVSSDVSRPHISAMHLDAAKRVLVATNGHMLASVPVTVDTDDHAGPVTVEALKAARKSAGKGDPILLVNGAQQIPGGASFPRPSGFTFPPYEAILPKYKRGDDGTLTIGLNASYLRALADAIGAKDGNIAITINLKDPAHDPFVVTCDADPRAIGVLMPVRLK